MSVSSLFAADMSAIMFDVKTHPSRLVLCPFISIQLLFFRVINVTFRVEILKDSYDI